MPNGKQSSQFGGLYGLNVNGGWLQGSHPQVAKYCLASVRGKRCPNFNFIYPISFLMVGAPGFILTLTLGLSSEPGGRLLFGLDQSLKNI